MKTTDINRKRPVDIRICTRRAVLPALIAGAVILLVLGSCYAPILQSEQGFSMDVTMQSKGLPENDTVVLAGLLINSGFEEALKDVTQLTVALDSGLPSAEIEAEIEDKLEEILIDVALGGTMKFSGNPYFAIEVDYDSGNQEADFTVTGVPANKDYFLYMGGFNTIDEVKQFFGLMEEDAEFDEDLINYSHLFYIDGPTGPPVTIPFEDEGVNSPGDCVDSDTNTKYEGPGWYYVEPWSGLTTTIKAPAGQPFSVEPGKTTKVKVYLTDDSAPLLN
ncbi:MAG: hypothetical protein K9M94_05095 [Spirochaetia bacterium]|nr:hypothetical protein [Spirochaetia bacterium]